MRDSRVNMQIIGEEEDANPSDDSVTVIDIVDAHRLKEIELDKKGWTAYIKGIKYAFCLLGFHRILKES